MNLKYYLRGLGIGIIVTALIMGISMGGQKEPLSDEEIKMRASELGMVEESMTLEDNLPAKEKMPEEQSSEPQEVHQKADTEEQAEKAEGTETGEQAEKIKETEAGNKAEEEAEAKEKEEQEKALQLEADLREAKDDAKAEKTPAPSLQTPAKKGETCTIEVKKGDGSYSVCKRLEDAGLITSASSFDTFLCDNGYDKRIRAGSFEVPADADPEQIARILVGLE